jgi:hypothetical protein
MDEKPNFILVPHDDAPPPKPPGLLARLGGFLTNRTAVAPLGRDAGPPAAWSGRPRLVFGFDATASREPAWAVARQVTDSLVRALPGALDVALAVHGGSRLHTFTDFTSDPNRLRDTAAGIVCRAGSTRLLPILQRSLASPGVRVVVYIGDVFEESPGLGRKLADEMGRHGMRLIVLHDTADWMARRDAELFLDLARRTGGCVLPFDASAPARLREILEAAAAYAVGGVDLLRQRGDAGALMLLRHLPGK